MEKRDIITLFRLHKEDRGSICVEIGLLSETILFIEEKLKIVTNQSLFRQYRLEFIHLVKKRRELLDYLFLVNIPLYNKVIQRIEKLEKSVQGLYFPLHKHKNKSYLKSYKLLKF
ncbi:MAG: 30S ribosomal protein S15 [Chlamydiia bacterium]|nr:30S ribosomal protein S15 [Chlamydiia bacterium]